MSVGSHSSMLPMSRFSSHLAGHAVRDHLRFVGLLICLDQHLQILRHHRLSTASWPRSPSSPRSIPIRSTRTIEISSNSDEIIEDDLDPDRYKPPSNISDIQAELFAPSFIVSVSSEIPSSGGKWRHPTPSTDPSSLLTIVGDRLQSVTRMKTPKMPNKQATPNEESTPDEQSMPDEQSTPTSNPRPTSKYSMSSPQAFEIGCRIRMTPACESCRLLGHSTTVICSSRAELAPCSVLTSVRISTAKAIICVRFIWPCSASTPAQSNCWTKQLDVCVFRRSRKRWIFRLNFSHAKFRLQIIFIGWQSFDSKLLSEDFWIFNRIN